MITVHHSGFDGHDRLWGHIEYGGELWVNERWIFWGSTHGHLQFRRCPNDAIFRKNCVKKSRKYTHAGRPAAAVVKSFEEFLIIRKLTHGN